MAETLNVKERDKGGKRELRRLRRTGGIPAVLYGHGEANKNLAVVADEMAAVVRHGGRVVDLAGDVQEKAFIRALQWDTYGTHVLHVDFTRVSAHERIEVMVSLELERPSRRRQGRRGRRTPRTRSRNRVRSPGHPRKA